jgi:hypothetical protein
VSHPNKSDEILKVMPAKTAERVTDQIACANNLQWRPLSMARRRSVGESSHREREYGTARNELNKWKALKDPENFRLFRYFRLFRHLSSPFFF